MRAAQGEASGELARAFELLRARRPELASRLSAAFAELSRRPEAPRLEMLASERGEPSARLGGLLLHSAYDPRGEARRLLSAALPPEADTLLVLGTGLGYGLEAALEDSGIERVLLCEAEPALLLEALSRRELGPALAEERLSLMLGGRPENLLSVLESLGSRRIGILGSRACEASSPDWYGRLRAAAERFKAKGEINESTLRRFGRLWVRNLAKNLPRLAELPGIEGLRGRFAGLPALVLAAGPSLDELLPLLPRLRERALLIAVDTALRSLLVAGVEPDFLVVVDPQYWNWRHVAGLRAPSSLLVSEPAVYPAVLRLSSRAAFLADSLFPLGRALGGAGRGFLGAGGSVATTAWDLARHLGASPIYLGGLDLGYPGGGTHARSSLFEARSLAAGSRLAPAASAQAAALFGAPSRRLADNEGRPLLSDSRMSLYAWWFEARLARPDSPPTLSLCPRGLAIPGLPLSTAEALLEGEPLRAEIEERLALSAALEPEAGAEAALSASLEALIGELRGLASLAEGAVLAAAEAGRRLGRGEEAADCLRRLEAADRAILGSGAKEVAAFLLPPLGELLGPRPRDLRESLARSEALYRRLAESVAYHLDMLGGGENGRNR